MNKIKLTCLTISFLWIALGTFIQLSSYPSYNYLNFDYSSFIFNFLWWITFPFNILLFFLLYIDALNNIYIIIIFLQSVKVLVYWWIIYKIYLYFKK
jgi:hypothetical protein